MAGGNEGPADGASTSPARRSGGPPVPGYRERLRPPLWWYPLAMLIATILAAEFQVGGIIPSAWIPLGILVPLSVIFVWWLGRGTLTIRDGEVHIRDAHLPLRYVSGAVGLDPRTLRLVVGREGDPAAFVQIRPWVGPGVQLWLDDEDDPTPYWVISTRRPAAVLEVVNAQRAAGRGSGPIR